MQHFTENDMTVLKSDAELNSKPNAEPDTGFDTQKEDAVYQTEETMYDVPVSAIASQERQQQLLGKVYQGIKEYFSDLELLDGILIWMAIIWRSVRPCSSFLTQQRNTVPNFYTLRTS